MQNHNFFFWGGGGGDPTQDNPMMISFSLIIPLDKPTAQKEGPNTETTFLTTHTT